MKLKYNLLLFVILLANTASAQFDASNAANRVIIKFAPMAMFDLDNTLQFGVEVPFKNNKISIQQDLGYGATGISFWYQGSNRVPEKDIFKSRTTLRFYYFEKRRVRGYAGVEALLKKVVYRENQWVGMDCSGFGGCNFFENRRVTVGRMAVAGHGKLGWQFYFPGRMSLDIFTGLGLRNVRIENLTPNLPDDAQIRAPRENFYDMEPGSTYFVPSLALGFHLGIILGKLPGRD